MQGSRIVPADEAVGAGQGLGRLFQLLHLTMVQVVWNKSARPRLKYDTLS